MCMFEEEEEEYDKDSSTSGDDDQESQEHDSLRLACHGREWTVLPLFAGVLTALCLLAVVAWASARGHVAVRDSFRTLHPLAVLGHLSGGTDHEADELQAGQRTFSTAAEAFRFLDRNGDGVLDFAGDGVQLIGNATLHVHFFEFEQYFLAEHRKMVSEEGLHAPKTRLVISHYGSLLAANLTARRGAEAPRPMALSLGANGSFSERLVDELYTFGAPGLAVNFLYDATQDRGCIPGLRVFSRGSRFAPGYGVSFEVNDPVAWITASFNYDHAKMDSLVLLENNHEVAPIRACSGDYSHVVQTPPRDDFWWLAGHMVYERALRAHTDRATARGDAQRNGTAAARRLEKAYVMSHFSMANYHSHTPKLGLDAQDWGWAFVGRACSQKLGYHAPRCTDHVTLYQDGETLECAMIFEGTDDVLDILADMDTAVEDFCSFGPVHRGFKRKLMAMLKSVDYQQVIRRKLPMCAGVTVAGHSMGGAQAEMFAGCANKAVHEQESGFEDFRYIFFEKSSPQRLLPFFSDHAKGYFYRNKGTGLCLDVHGTMQTKYEMPVNLFDCEFLDSDYYKDQRWEFTDEGYFVSRLSGMCIGVVPPEQSGSFRDAELRQQTCHFEDPDRGQQWQATHEGFLKHKLSGLCLGVSLKLVTCPYTDQKWELQPSGRIVNKLSGKCLDVTGSPGIDEGAALKLWPCESRAQTDQVWQLTPEGTLLNKLSAKCVGVRLRQGREAHPQLVLTECSINAPGDSLIWIHTDDGFFRDKRTGMCIDVEGKPGTDSGSHIELGSCEDQHIVSSDRWVHHLNSGLLRNVGDAEEYIGQLRCLELFHERGTRDSWTEGAKLHLQLCKVATDQKWELTDRGYLRNVIGGQKCLDIRRGGRDSLWLQNCEEPGDPALYWDWKWRLMPDGAIKNLQSGECIDVMGSPGIKDGSAITTWACEQDNSTDQRWNLLDDGRIINTLSKKCLDVMGLPGTTDGAPLLLSHCEGNSTRTDQRWDLTQDGFLKNRLSGKCGVRARTGLILEPCPATAQLWDLTDGGLLRNRKTGLCVDASQNHSELGAKPFWDLVVWQCDTQRSLQQWEVIAGTTLGRSTPETLKACAAHPRCAALEGRCCPNQAGTMLPCCGL